MSCAKIPVVVLIGPTASGKTDVLKELFTGENKIADAEIISADSMQVYKGLDIGTAKPDRGLLEKLPHHLLDILSPNEQFNAADFALLAREKCKEIYERNKAPVISGGTGFYINAFLYGVSEAPKANLEIRDTLKKELGMYGINKLIEELRASDPLSAQRISPGDTYRVLRALEVYRSSGKPLSSFARVSSTVKKKIENEFILLILSLEWDRAVLYKRIEERCKKMFETGLYNEVKNLFRSGLTPDFPALKAIGYREFFKKNDIENTYVLRDDIDNVYNEVFLNTRHYAKRQITWFKQIKNSMRINMPLQNHDIAGIVRNFYFENSFPGCNREINPGIPYGI